MHGPISTPLALASMRPPSGARRPPIPAPAFRSRPPCRASSMDSWPPTLLRVRAMPAPSETRSAPSPPPTPDRRTRCPIWRLAGRRQTRKKRRFASRGPNGAVACRHDDAPSFATRSWGPSTCLRIVDAEAGRRPASKLLPAGPELRPVPARAVPAGAVPARTVPARTVPARAVPARPVPAGAVPAESCRPERLEWPTKLGGSDATSQQPPPPRAPHRFSSDAGGDEDDS